MALKMFEAVGEQIANDWQEAGGQIETFAPCALARLQAARLHDSFSTEAFLSAIAATSELPRQYALHTSFGHPPVTVFRTPRFMIDVYFWLSPQTTIHSHSFSGAFCVLHGTSLHVTYRFDGDLPGTEAPSLGRMSCEQSELLRVGEVREIGQSTRLIHQVWHLSRPSISLVARTLSDGPAARILNYEPPGLCVIDSRNALSEAGTRKLQLIRSLAMLAHPQLTQFICDAVSLDNDMHAYWYLRTAFVQTRDCDLLRRILDSTRLAGVAWAETLVDSLASAAWAQADPPRVEDQDGRFMLALLLSVEDREQIRQLIQSYDASRSVGDSVVAWLTSLIDLKAINLELNETAQVVLASNLDQLDVPATAGRLARLYEIDDTAMLERDVTACLTSMAAHPLLKNLLA